ncbi:unnamed protein product [Closterium sp. NIES-53]
MTGGGCFAASAGGEGRSQGEEDALLRQLVERGGAKGWTAIAAHLNGRAGKQCRERWHNHLKRGIKKVIITRIIG